VAFGSRSNDRCGPLYRNKVCTGDTFFAWFAHVEIEEFYGMKKPSMTLAVAMLVNP
jgi:hypothetical protein